MTTKIALSPKSAIKNVNLISFISVRMLSADTEGTANFDVHLLIKCYIKGKHKIYEKYHWIRKTLGRHSSYQRDEDSIS